LEIFQLYHASSLKLKIPKGQPEAVNRRRTDNKWSKEKGVIDCCLMPTQFSNFPAGGGMEIVCDVIDEHQE
jgi:hypothetical protein